jgi:MOSC domain-containing protein YiiM
MTRRASITVGNYTYSAQDAHKTLSMLEEIWSYYTHESQIPEGWLAGTRGFLAEISSLGGIALPPLENVDAAFASVTAALDAKYDELIDGQREALLAAAWRFFPTMRLLSHEHTGVVAHLHASKGLPKKPIDTASIGWRGIEGDVQSSRVHHGRPWQALCVWSTDAIDALRAQGHPIAPGFAGDNITISGIPADAFRPGAHFRIGAVRGFFSAYTIPCSKNNEWFQNKNIMAMSHTQGNFSRIYAMVTHTGTISVGDTCELFTDR